MGEHTHGRCDSTCPSYAHGCMNCPACRERHEQAGEVWRSVDVDGRLPIEDEAERITEASFFNAPLTGVETRFKEESLGRPRLALLAESKLAEFVLTWHPVDDTQPPVEIPLYEHVELPAGFGELRSHTREVGPVGEGDENSLHNPAAALAVDFLGLAGVTVTAEQAGGWTREQRQKAVQWAAATHLSASDNDVDVPPRPAFLSEVRGV